MTSDTDRIIDRRRMKRSLTVWRGIAVLALVSVIGAVTARFDVLPEEDYVALLDVTGLILEDSERDDALEQLASDDNVKALIVRIDSPGGTFVGGEALYLGIRSLSEKKPVVAVIGDLGTSAAYMAAIATRRILVRSGTITGSIGVIMQSADLTGLLEKIGIQPEIIKSDPLKAQPNPAESFTPEGRAMLESVISDLHDIFVGMVAERRNMTFEDARRVSDGRIWTGRQAMAVGLVDEIGGRQEALDWLAETAEIATDLPLRNVTPVDDVERWAGIFSKFMGKTLISERLSLDGALALWHPLFNM